MLIRPELGRSSLRAQMRRLGRSEEEACVLALLEQGGVPLAQRQQVERRAASLVQSIRSRRHYGADINGLLNEYSLSSQEGVLLMCLAEALLRVPDQLTADRLIADKLGGGDWQAHLGQGASLFVNASAWGLLLSGKVIGLQQAGGERPLQRLSQIVGRAGEPALRAAMRLAMRIMGKQFVLGTNVSEALDRSATWQGRGYCYTYDMLGEAARTGDYARDYFDSYCAAIERVGRTAASTSPVTGPGFSIKLSALHPRCELAQFGRLRRELAPRVLELARLAREHSLGLTIDAEEAHRLDLTLAIFEQVFSDPSLRGWEGLGIAVQAYLKSAPAVIDWLGELARGRHRKIMVRLVKGAYWDAEIKLAQSLGYEHYPVYTRKASSDLAYLVGARKLLGGRDALYPQFATHNAHAVAAVLQLAGDTRGYEFQRLHGMGEELYDELIGQQGVAVACRIYAPVGEHAELLAYLVRRLLENGANSSFVHKLADDRISDSQLAEDPARTLSGFDRLTNAAIPLPVAIFGQGRAAAAGVDLDDVDVLARIAADLGPWRPGMAAVACSGDAPDALQVTDPAHRDDVLGYYIACGERALERCLENAAGAFPAWSGLPVAQRAATLHRAADLLEHHCHELAGFCIREAGKTLRDAIADIREAVDFCRYYAEQAMAMWRCDGAAPHPRGVLLCISPWNFPVAIFAGQVSAALVSGNTVLAKPAEQTTLTALRVVQLFHQAGVPAAVLQAVAGPGEPIGRRLLPDPRIAGVLFTGSSEVARSIAHMLAQRVGERAPLIAETGGQNAMVVDSTALLEKVVDDVIASGFNSAGQRCSALRVLLVQDEIAEPLIAMLIGAMRELRLGDPAELATDVGPIIDAEALGRLQAHLGLIRDSGRLLYQCDLGAGTESGHFFAPALVELDDIDALGQEVFGPIVHLVRFRAEGLDTLPAMINRSGYGLTFGVHSRIEATVDRLCREVSAGNIYVNRNIIGAVVGVQPFGGRGLSGTGPKAGGPFYLERLVRRGASAAREPRPVLSAHRAPSPSPSPSPSADAGIGAWGSAITALAGASSTWRETAMAERTTCAARLRDQAGLSDRAAGKPSLSWPAVIDSLIHQAQGLALPMALAGPTGESNTLGLEARGVMVCVADARVASAVPAMAALLAGNGVLLAVRGESAAADALRRALVAAGFPEEAVAVSGGLGHPELAALIRHGAIAGVATWRDQALEQLASRALAEREGAILPLIDDAFGPAYLSRFCYEKTISINTTAAGGNAALMAGGEPD